MSKPSSLRSGNDILTHEALAFGVARVGKAFVGFPLDQMSEVCGLRDLHPLMVSSSYLLGGMDLRGHLIPVLDLQAICGLGTAERGGFAVVVRRDDRLMAFPVDEVMGIARIAPARIQDLSDPASASGCVRGVFFDDDRPISIIGLDTICDLPGVFSVAAPQVRQSRDFESELVPMLVFEVGGARFSVRAEDVYGTVPRQSIEVNAITSGFCLGSITYHNRRAPVLSSSMVLGIGAHVVRNQTEVVVLRCPHQCLLGLAVDSILDVRAVDPRRCLAVPRVMGMASEFLSGVILNEDGAQTYTIAADLFLAEPRIQSILSLSTPVGEAGEHTRAGLRTGARGDIQRFLVFKAGRVFATPLGQVECILQPPKDVVPLTSPAMGLEGLFIRDRATVPLVDLNDRLGHERDTTGLERVLLVAAGSAQLGFRVERVLSIESAGWVLDGLTTGDQWSEPLVQLGRGEERRALPILDLTTLAGDYFQPNAAS